MAVTLRKSPIVEICGNKTRRAIFSLNMGTYATSGVAFSPTTEVGGSSVVLASIPNQNGRQYEYVESTGLVKIRSAAGTEVANATDLSAETVRAEFLIQ